MLHAIIALQCNAPEGVKFFFGGTTGVLGYRPDLAQPVADTAKGSIKRNSFRGSPLYAPWHRQVSKAPEPLHWRHQNRSAAMRRQIDSSIGPLRRVSIDRHDMGWNTVTCTPSEELKTGTIPCNAAHAEVNSYGPHVLSRKFTSRGDLARRIQARRNLSDGRSLGWVSLKL